MVAKHCDGDCGNLECKISCLEEERDYTYALLQAARDFKLKDKVDKLRFALSQMDLTICSMGDLMTKEDMDEVLRLELLRDTVLEETSNE